MPVHSVVTKTGTAIGAGWASRTSSVPNRREAYACIRKLLFGPLYLGPSCMSDLGAVS